MALPLFEHGVARKVFWDDPYCSVFSTRIRSVAGNELSLEETIFFAFSGGQESDAGTIASWPVEDARTSGFDIIYTLAPGHGLVAGQSVQIKIDWARRYRLMRLHFAAELVLELIYRIAPRTEKTGAHIGAQKARIDLAWDASIASLLPTLQQDVARIVCADHAITSAFSDPAMQRRYWELEGFARVPCGGTHLRRTSEVGPIELRRKNVGRGRERIEIRLAQGNAA